MRSLSKILVSLAALAGCNTGPVHGPQSSARTSDARDCAVLTAALKDYYEIRSSTPLHLKRGERAKRDYVISCDFRSEGVPINDFDYAHKDRAGDVQSWIGFSAPLYPTATTAIVESALVRGPLNGEGATCTLNLTQAGWKIHACALSWIS